MDQEMNNQEVEIDLLSLFKVIVQKWWIVAGFVVLGLVATGLYAYLMKDDVYTAESSMIVQVTADNSTSSYNDVLTGQRLVDTYSQIAESNRVLSQLRQDLNLNYTDAQLRNMIKVSSVNNTLIVKLEVESTNPSLASSIANTTVLIVQSLSSDFQGLESVDILDTASTPTSPSGPNRVLYLAIGLLLGGMVGVGVVLGFEFLDKNIKKGKDIEQYLGLRVLGTIPDYEMNEEVEADV